MKTLSNRIYYRLFFLLATLFLITGFSFRSTAQGKKIYVGTGSGFIDYPNAQATLGLQDDDTVMINPGKYKNMTFKNITASPGHRIYIMNSGQVEFNDPQPSWFSNLTNVDIRGDGTPGIDFGFYMHDLIRAIYIDGSMSGVSFSYIKMLNIADYSIFLYNPSLYYDGTNNANSLFYDLKFLHISAYNIMTTFLQVGVYTTILDDGLRNMIRKLEVGYCTVDYTDQEDVLHLNKVVNANIHHNRFSHLGKNDFRHTGIIYLYGNGDVHHNYISDYWGSGLRAHGFSLDAVGAVNVYNNVMVNSRKYSAIEAQITPADMAYSSYLHYCNYKIYNNTFGNLSAYDWSCSMVDTYDAMGGTIEIKNNLGFNIQRDKPYNPAWNFIYQQLNVTVPDTSNNLYARTFAELGLKEDTSCFLDISSPAIDKGKTISMVNDDIDGVLRPQSAAYDIGAREYVTGITYPVSNAGADTSLVLPKDSITLSGAASYNPGGGSLTYKWTEMSGPSAVVFASDTSVQPVIKNLVQGNYQFQLTVTNAQGRSSSDIIIVAVSPVPVYPPVAKAGGTITITLPVNSTNLNGSSSTSTGGTLKYVWTKISGPASFSITGDSTATPTVGNLIQGTYQVQLTVTDTNRLSNTDIVTVIVKPAPVPVANAGVDINLVLPANSTALDGSSSSMPGGGALTYVWTKVSGPASFNITGDSTANPSISNLVEGTYQLKLTVTSTTGTSATDFINIVVAASPVAVANAGSDISLTLPSNSTALNGSASYSTGGGILTYAWSKVSGPASFNIVNENTASPTISNLVEGSYQIKLTVTNTQGSSAEDIVVVTVSAMPVYTPVSNAGTDFYITLPTNSVVLNGDQSYNPGGGALIFAWTKISGPASFTISSASTATPAVSNLVEGAYQVQLKVTNVQGVSSEDTVNITVSPAAPVPPVANVGAADISLVLPSNSTTLNGSASYDPSGAALTYSWTKIAGPNEFTIAGANTAVPNISNLTIGNYTVALTVTNANGLSSSADVNIIVTASLLAVPDAGKDTTINFPNGYAILNGTHSYPTNGASTLHYHWQQLSGPTTAVIGNSDAGLTTATNLEPGAYVFQLAVTDNYGQKATTTLKVTVVSSTRYLKLISLYPNPCSDKLHIHAIADSMGTVLVRVTNMSGIVMFTKTFQKNQLQFDEQLPVSQLPAGLYIVEIIMGKEALLIDKFIKR